MKRILPLIFLFIGGTVSAAEWVCPASGFSHKSCGAKQGEFWNLWSNGTPETWLAQYYPATNDYPAAAGSDTDGDGRTAWEEYIGGSDPTNRDSRFAILDIGFGSGSNYVRWISWNADPSLPPYRVIANTNMNSNVWAEVGTKNRVGGVVTNILWHVDPPTNWIFYRVVATNSP